MVNVLGIMLNVSSTRLSAATASFFVRRLEVVAGFCASLSKAVKKRKQTSNMRLKSVNSVGFGCVVKMPLFNGQT